MWRGQGRGGCACHEELAVNVEPLLPDDGIITASPYVITLLMDKQNRVESFQLRNYWSKSMQVSVGINDRSQNLPTFLDILIFKLCVYKHSYNFLICVYFTWYPVCILSFTRQSISENVCHPCFSRMPRIHLHLSIGF